MGSRAPSRCPAHALIVGVLVWLTFRVSGAGPGGGPRARGAKSLGTLWKAFLPVDVGAAEHIFARYRIELEIVDMGNGNKLQQALASDSLDFGLAAGTDLVFPVKGAPVRAVLRWRRSPPSRGRS